MTISDVKKWKGLVWGKILTGNHGFYHHFFGFFPVNFPIIQFYKKKSGNDQKAWKFLGYPTWWQSQVFGFRRTSKFVNEATRIEVPVPLPYHSDSVSCLLSCTEYWILNIWQPHLNETGYSNHEMLHMASPKNELYSAQMPFRWYPLVI